MAVTDYYTVPTGNQTAGLFELSKFIGVTATEGLFFPVILFVVWIISFVSLMHYSTSRAFAFSSFFVSILSTFLAVIDLIAPKWMYLSIFMSAIGLVWLKLDDK